LSAYDKCRLGFAIRDFLTLFYKVNHGICCPEVKSRGLSWNQYDVRDCDCCGNHPHRLWAAIHENKVVLLCYGPKVLHHSRLIHGNHDRVVALFACRGQPVPQAPLWIGVDQKDRLTAFLKSSGKIGDDRRFAATAFFGKKCNNHIVVLCNCFIGVLHNTTFVQKCKLATARR
jgi:hypothetical protein